METLGQIRGQLLSLCIGTKLEGEGVHTVSFQPLESRVNQDRLVTEKWDIGGQTWLFLAVCDGKCLSHASQRTQLAFHVQAMVELRRPSIQPGPFLGAYVQRCVITPRCLAQIQ